MSYIKRQIEDDLNNAFQHYKTVLITSVRQIGKTRLINEYPKLKSYIYPMHFISQNKITSVKDLYFNTKEEYIDYVNYVNEIIAKRTEFYKSL